MSDPLKDVIAEMGFWIERRADIDVIVWRSGGCRPASSAESAMWAALAFSLEQEREEQKQVHTRVDAMGDGHDSPTAASNEVIR